MAAGGARPGDGNEDLAGNAQRLAAGGHQAEAGYLPGQGVGQARRGADDVLAVVEDDHERATGQVAGDELGRRSRRLSVTPSRPHHSERAGGGRGDRFGIGDAGQFDDPGATRVLLPQAARRLDGQTGLAYSTGSDQRDQAAGGDRFAHLSQLDVTPEESAQWFGHVAGHRRRHRWMGHRRPFGHEEGVVVEDAGFHLTQARARVDPELVDQAVTDLGVGPQRFGLASRSVERQHEQLPQALAERVVPAQRLQLAHQFVVMAELQVRFDSTLGCHQGQLVEMGPLGVGKAGVGELGQGLTPSQPQGFAEHGGRLGRLAHGAQTAPFGHQVLESGRVQVSGPDCERIAGFGGDDGGGAESSAQLDDLGLQGVGRFRRPPVAPELVDQAIGADRISATERQESQQGPLLGAANRYRRTPSDHLELAEEVHFHPPTVRPMTAGGCGSEPARLRATSAAPQGSSAECSPDRIGRREEATMIEARQLTKRYGKTVAVNEVSFTVRPGQVTGFLGPNGAGKSTTMRMILGLDTPTSGEVRVDGKPYHQLSNPLRSVGALLDAKAIVGGRSAANHLKWLADSNGIPRRRVAEVLDIVGLSDVAGKKVGTFSLGMSQRLGIAGALLGHPRL